MILTWWPRENDGMRFEMSLSCSLERDRIGARSAAVCGFELCLNININRGGYPDQPAAQRQGGAGARRRLWAIFQNIERDGP